MPMETWLLPKGPYPPRKLISSQRQSSIQTFRLNLDTLQTYTYSSSREIQSKGLSFHGCYSKGLPNGRRELAEWHSVLPAVLRQKVGGVSKSAPCFGMTEISLFSLISSLCDKFSLTDSIDLDETVAARRDLTGMAKALSGWQPKA